MRPALAAAAVGLALAFGISSGTVSGDEPVLTLHATVAGATTPEPLTIELFRWSTDVERAPMLAALTEPPPEPPEPPAGRAGRGGRRGRGGPAAPATPADRLKAAIQAAPTVGFIWGDGPTGYSIRYAWRSSLPDGRDRIVLATDRRLGANSTSWPPVSAEAASAEFTVIELRVGGAGDGEGKASLAAKVVVDSTAETLALEGYSAAPILFKVTR